MAINIGNADANWWEIFMKVKLKTDWYILIESNQIRTSLMQHSMKITGVNYFAEFKLSLSDTLMCLG
jgi:hypothetical protein